METRRLKNIAILILLLLNGVLLLLLETQRLQTRQTQADSVEQLEALFAAEELMLSEKADLSRQPLSALQLSRDAGTEAAIAAYLLGSETASVNEGGGIYTYSTEAGSVQFRSGGSFESSGLRQSISDAQMFAQQFCSQFGFDELDIRSTDRGTAITAVQYVSGVPVDGCSVTFLLEEGMLVSAAGSLISLEGAVSESGNLLSATTALVRFLDYRRSSGVVCRQVDDVRCIYQLQSNSSTRRLVPLWLVDTDTHDYLVDCSAGQVIRR